MDNQAKILGWITGALEEVNLMLPQDQKITISGEAVLFGPKSLLDSLGLVNLIVALEQKIDEETGAHVDLAGESAFSQNNSPFRNVQTLAEYVEELINGSICK